MWAQTSLCWLHCLTTFYCCSVRLYESQWNETTANVVKPNNACLQSIVLLLNLRIGLIHDTDILVFSISLRRNVNVTEFNQCHMKHLTGCGSNHTYSQFLSVSWHMLYRNTEAKFSLTAGRHWFTLICQPILKHCLYLFYLFKVPFRGLQHYARPQDTLKAIIWI